MLVAINRRQGFESLWIHRLRKEPYRPVREGHIGAARVAAGDFGIRGMSFDFAAGTGVKPDPFGVDVSRFHLFCFNGYGTESGLS